jgi:hypothetical protein
MDDINAGVHVYMSDAIVDKEGLDACSRILMFGVV